MQSLSGSDRSMDEVDAGKKAEMPEQPQKVGGGTAKVLDAARQANTAREELARDQARSLIEEVLRRENLIEAHKRVVRNGVGHQEPTG